jgi:antirestriction protein ArdC
MPIKVSRAGADKMGNNNKYSERREQLRKTSNEVAELQKNGKIKTANLNDALLEFYSGRKKNQVWMTLEQWQSAGYSVRKGETAQMIWGKKVSKTNDAHEEFSYFPVVFIFNNTQVKRSSRNFKENSIPESRVPAIADAAANSDMPF